MMFPRGGVTAGFDKIKHRSTKQHVAQASNLVVEMYSIVLGRGFPGEEVLQDVIKSNLVQRSNM